MKEENRIAAHVVRTAWCAAIARGDKEMAALLRIELDRLERGMQLVYWLDPVTNRYRLVNGHHPTSRRDAARATIKKAEGK